MTRRLSLSSGADSLTARMAPPTDPISDSRSERPVRCEQAEEQGRFSAAPTEPPRPTEPIPNDAGACRPKSGAGAMRVNELAPSRPNLFRTAPPVVKCHLSVYDEA